MTHMRQLFRCLAGCCICGTKSSTSRFTSSNNYEAYFGPCFLIEGRCGEICNACVLIVKRFMKNPNSGHNWHHIVDNGHNKKNRKKVSLRIRQYKNTTGENYDARNWIPLPVIAPPPVNGSPSRYRVKYRHRTRQERADENVPNSVWLLLTQPEAPTIFFRDNKPYPRLSTLHQTAPEPPKQSSICQQSIVECHDQPTFLNPIEQPCLAKRCKQTQEPRVPTFFEHSCKNSGVTLTTPPRYPSPVGHHCYPTPATTPDLNTNNTSYAPTRPNTERCPASLSPLPPATYLRFEDDAPYKEACNSYMSSLSRSVSRSTSSLLEASSDATNSLSHLCQAMELDSHSSSTLVGCPNMWQGEPRGASLTADDSGCYDTGDSCHEMTAPSSPYNSPYPSPCPSDPVGVDEDGSLQCLSAIVANRPRLPVPTTCCGTSQPSRLNPSGPSLLLPVPVSKDPKEETRCSRRQKRTPRKGGRTTRLAPDEVTSSTYWTQKKTCCGIVNLGKNSELLLMAGQYKPCPAVEHDAACSAVLQRLSVNATAVPTAEQVSNTISENRSDSYEIMARDMALLHTRSTSTATLSSMASPVGSTASVTSQVLPLVASTANVTRRIRQPVVSTATVTSHIRRSVVSTTPTMTNRILSNNVNPSQGVLSSDRRNVRTTLADWNESSPQQLRTRAPLTNTQTTDNEYHIVGTMYHDWNNYYNDDTEKPHSDDETMTENNHSNTTYYNEVSQNCPVVTVSKVDALGALDLTKETGGWGMGPPTVVK